MSETHDFLTWLEDDEEKSRPYRVERLKLLVDEYGREGGRMFYGGLVSLWAFEECRLAYLHGLFLSCILASQVCVEHMLSALFRMAGRDDLERATFDSLLREARDERYLSDDEFVLFDRLRTLRNPYAHPRAPTSKDALMVRAMD
ncbi:MAG: hypothetical protein V3V56_09435, partial [bacterium]